MRKSSNSGSSSAAAPPDEACQLGIINLLPTCKDGLAAVVSHFPCDRILREVMQRLDIVVPDYDPKEDPLLKLATPLPSEEAETTTRKSIFRN